MAGARAPGRRNGQLGGDQRCRRDPGAVRYVTYLRAKLEPDPAHPKYIVTEKGLGYRFADLGAHIRLLRRPDPGVRIGA